jgi:hypothetical protein
MSYLPIRYYADFLHFLDRYRARIDVITYKDLPWAGDWAYEAHYPGEAAAWASEMEHGDRDPRKAYLLLQHDVDSVPSRTLEVLKLEEELGLRSTVMIFNKRFDRRHFRHTGEFRDSDYLDADAYAYLKRLEAKGFLIGYHCNAYERSRFSRKDAQRILLEDIEELRRHFSIEFMSAHGGPAGPDGRSNDSLELPGSLRENIRWVHNGHSISSVVTYSDGGINSGKRPPDTFDLRGFMSRLVPGRRYRVLTHPQYYTGEVERNARLESPWYGEILAAYAGRADRDTWCNVHPQALGTADLRFLVVSARRWGARLSRKLRKMTGVGSK